MGAKIIKIKGLVYPPLSPISNDICKISKHKKRKICRSDNILSPRFKR